MTIRERFLPDFIKALGQSSGSFAYLEFLEKIGKAGILEQDNFLSLQKEEKYALLLAYQDCVTVENIKN